MRKRQCIFDHVHEAPNRTKAKRKKLDCQVLRKEGGTFRDNDVFITAIIRHGLYVKTQQLYIYHM